MLSFCCLLFNELFSPSEANASKDPLLYIHTQHGHGSLYRSSVALSVSHKSLSPSPQTAGSVWLLEAFRRRCARARPVSRDETRRANASLRDTTSDATSCVKASSLCVLVVEVRVKKSTSFSSFLSDANALTRCARTMALSLSSSLSPSPRQRARDQCRVYESERV